MLNQMPRDLPTDTFTFVILALGAISFVLSLVLVGVMVRVAPRLGFVDRPGGRKAHGGAMPLGGGVGIFLAIALPMLAVVGFVLVRGPAFERGQRTTIISGVSAPAPAYWSGAREKVPLALAIVAAVAAMHLLGLADDRWALGPFVKLICQLAIIAALVAPFRELRILWALDGFLHTRGLLPAILAILWIAAITNAFNFLDNMDGLSAGVGAVCTTAFLAATLSIHQWFVAATLATLLGSMLGFLWWNFPPARIFMGDAGSLVIGLMLGVLTVLTTYLPPGVSWGAGWYDVFAPVIVLALPLYDLLVVSAIRMRRGRSPFVGDTNHFSHRLVRMGLSKRAAVLCLYLISAATAVAAIVLPHVSSSWAAILIFAQTLMILGVAALLELRAVGSRPEQT
jgi:UDP-GlcNAc:undecaprenyl-phosphate/decaprenyl-phosphate GlcNAc-1-phosphate transferase